MSQLGARVLGCGCCQLWWWCYLGGIGRWPRDDAGGRCRPLHACRPCLAAVQGAPPPLQWPTHHTHTLLPRRDYNQKHFVRNEGFAEAADEIQGDLRKIFIEFLERSCTAGARLGALGGTAQHGRARPGAGPGPLLHGAGRCVCARARVALLSPPHPAAPTLRVLRLPALQGAGAPPEALQPGGGRDLHAAGPRRGPPRRLHQQGAQRCVRAQGWAA